LTQEQLHFFTQNLKQRLTHALPGQLAHQLMMATTRYNTNISPNAKTKRSAVLILFYIAQNQLHTTMILRPPYDGAHGGQMAFPGGQHEKTDENLVRTALREAQEEIGIRTQDVHVLGQLTEIFIPVSNYHVLPVLGIYPHRPDFFPDPKEVAEIVEIPLADILNPNLVGQEQLNIRGLEINAPTYYFAGQKIWGATAMIIAELKMILETMT
jgi:8-oxo-dGTP pyrophosphatase MutT (NUDIX family)